MVRLHNNQPTCLGTINMHTSIDIYDINIYARGRDISVEHWTTNLATRVRSHVGVVLSDLMCAIFSMELGCQYVTAGTPVGKWCGTIKAVGNTDHTRQTWIHMQTPLSPYWPSMTFPVISLIFAAVFQAFRSKPSWNAYKFSLIAQAASFLTKKHLKYACSYFPYFHEISYFSLFCHNDDISNGIQM